jgi:hypothetical protein
MPITHAFVSPVADDSDPNSASPSNWNADHVWLAETTDPVSPVEGQCWVLVTGTTPTCVISLKCRHLGVTQVVASITY